MNRKIFIGIFAVALTVWLACIVCILGALYYYFNKKSAEEFRNEAIFVAQGIETSGAQYLEELSASPRRHSEDVRITWIAGDGTVLYDNYTDAAKLESHADREEFREALESGSGQSVRYSSTQMEKIIYYAIKLNDGSVLRVSDTQYTVLSVVVVMLSPILLILIVSLILAAVFAGRISKSIIRRSMQSIWSIRKIRKHTTSWLRCWKKSTRRTNKSQDKWKSCAAAGGNLNP